MQNGSPIYQQYLRETLIRTVVAAAVAGNAKDISMLFAREEDSAALEALAMAIVTYAGVMEDGELVHPLLERLKSETVPAPRAALVRALARTRGPASALLKQIGALGYEELIQDPAPEVREAIVANLIAEDSVNPGFPEIPDNAIAVAVRSLDPETGGRILESVSILSASAESIDKVLALLYSDHLPLRRGAAKALGTVKAAHAHRVIQELEARYRIESDRDVRKNILEAIVRLGFANAAPILMSLRGLDLTLEAEIDTWLEALKLNRQQWMYLRREKERLAKIKGL
jgi:HEAT repeat protein